MIRNVETLPANMKVSDAIEFYSSDIATKAIRLPMARPASWP